MDAGIVGVSHIIVDRTKVHANASNSKIIQEKCFAEVKEANDSNGLVRMVEAVERTSDETVEAVDADSDFFRSEAMQSLESLRKDICALDNLATTKMRRGELETLVYDEKFVYDADRDVFVCPEGNERVFRRLNNSSALLAQSGPCRAIRVVWTQTFFGLHTVELGKLKCTIGHERDSSYRSVIIWVSGLSTPFIRESVDNSYRHARSITYLQRSRLWFIEDVLHRLHVHRPPGAAHQRANE